MELLRKSISYLYKGLVLSGGVLQLFFPRRWIWVPDEYPHDYVDCLLYAVERHVLFIWSYLLIYDYFYFIHYSYFYKALRSNDHQFAHIETPGSKLRQRNEVIRFRHKD